MKDARRVVQSRARRARRLAARRAGARALVLSLVAAVPGTVGHPLVALTANAVPLAGSTAGATDAPLQVPQPGGLTDPQWLPETPATQEAELATLTGLTGLAAAPSARLPFAQAAAVIADATGQDALATKLLHAAPVGTNGMVPGPAAIKALTFAFAQIGKPYLWGGNGPASYDCSGLTQQSYLHAGVLIPRTSAEQATVGVPVRLADLIPGDLIFYAYNVHDARTIHHVAMYAGNGLLVHAPQTGEVVHLSPVWLDGYIGAVRLVPAVPRDGAPTVGPVAGPGLPTPTDPPTAPPSGSPTGTPTDPATAVPTGSPSDPPTSSEPPTTEPPSDPPTSSDPPPTTTEPPTSDPGTPTDPPTSSEPPPSTPDPTPTDAPTSAAPSDAPTSAAPTDSASPSDTAQATPAATPTATGTPSGP